jgi:hypothetical protein
MNVSIIFRNIFQEFGADVKKFITLNEPKETSIQGMIVND